MARPPTTIKDDLKCPACGVDPSNPQEGHKITSKVKTYSAENVPATFDLWYECHRCKATWKGGTI